MQESNNAQNKLIPNSAPVLAIVVILPVPILYPIKNSPGPRALIASKNFL